LGPIVFFRLAALGGYSLHLPLRFFSFLKWIKPKPIIPLLLLRDIKLAAMFLKALGTDRMKGTDMRWSISIAHHAVTLCPMLLGYPMAKSSFLVSLICQVSCQKLAFISSLYSVCLMTDSLMYNRKYGRMIYE
jgi:uncharacterized membrane protein YcfT